MNFSLPCFEGSSDRRAREADVHVDPKQRRLGWSGLMRDNSLFNNLSNSSRSSALTSVFRRSRGTCCIGLKAATVRTTAPSSNWKNLKSSAFNGSRITHHRRLRDNLPAETRHSESASQSWCSPAGESPDRASPSKAPGSKCCVSRRQRRPRSVHSDCMGCLLSHEMSMPQGRRP